MKRLAAFLLASLAIAGCKPAPERAMSSTCKPHPRLDALAARDLPSDAADCGCANMNSYPQELAKVHRCAAEHFQNRRPFRARFDVQSVDNHVTEIVAGTGDGRLIQYTEDSMSPDLKRVVCIAPALSPDRQRVYCPDIRNRR